VAVEKLTSRNRVRKHRARMSHKRFSLSAYTFLVTHFESVFRKIDFFNSHDFYLTHSSFDYAPGLLIWHSTDLVNWRPVAAALRRYYGSVWAPYLCEYDKHFYIYFPVNNRLNVVHAEHPEGPWSEPVDLGISAIDPAHIAEDGRRFLYMNGGQMAELTPDGLHVKVAPRAAFEAWPVPSTTRMECTCLEGPKVLEHNGMFYLMSPKAAPADLRPAILSSALAASMQRVRGSSPLITRSFTPNLELTAGKVWATAVLWIHPMVSGT